jgi:Flp pilus assembly protein TadG
MTNRTSHANKASQKGMAMVESAIILSLFLMLIFGVFEAGRFMNTQQVLTNAAREGARLAIAPLSGTNTLASESEITTRVNDFLASAGISDVDITIDSAVTVATGSVDTVYTRVRVDSDYQVITVPGFFSVLEVTLRGEALMRNETSE